MLANLEKHDCLPPLPPHVTVSVAGPRGATLTQDDVYEVLRSLDSPRGVRVSEIVRHCYGADVLSERYEKCHQRVSQRLLQLEADERAARVGHARGKYSRPAVLWRAL